MATSKAIRVVECKVGLPPAEAAWVGTQSELFKTAQALVEGYVEFASVGAPGVRVVANEEGRYKWQEANACGFFGPFAFVGVTTGGQAMRSLTDDEVRKCMAFYEKFKSVPPADDEVGVVFGEAAIDAFRRRSDEVRRELAAQWAAL